MIKNCFENKKICTLLGTIDAKDLEFNPHPKFKGVSLKNLVTGELTNNEISCHLVRVEPFCTLDTHIHEKSLEIHDVIYGSGTFYLGDKEFIYTKGSVGVIPAGIPHKVKAGSDGLYILAKFIRP